MGIGTRFFSSRRPWRWLGPLAVLAGLLALQVAAPAWAARPEAWAVDARFHLRGPESPRSPIVVVAADEASFQMLGELSGENVRTWPRSRWADLVTRIAAGRPKVVALDLVFDTPGWDAGGDAALAQALAATGSSVLPANLELVTAGGDSSATFSPPVDALAQAVTGVGVSTFPTDADGAIRRLTMLYPWGGRTYPAFALAIAVLAGGAPVDVPQADLGQDLSLPINFRGPEGTFHTVPLYQVMSGESDPSLFRDAIVLVGYTTQLEQDRHLAPFGGRSRLPGVEIHANAVDTLLAGDWLHRAPAWLAPVLVGALGLLALAALNLGRPAVGLLAAGGGLCLYLLLAGVLFVRAGLILPVVAPLVSAVAVGGTALAERTILAEREKRLIRQRFAGVMSPERLRAVMDHWSELQHPDRRVKPAAVLFADIRGFTHATETLMAQGRTGEMVAFLTAYLDAMSAAVFAEGGVIYRMLGDGLLILFGLPEPLPDYALRAVRAALGMARAAEALQPAWPLRQEGDFRMGIGVNAGSMADGIVGTGRQLDYSVVGDSVNTAARIESHCKVAMAIPRPPGGAVPEQVTILLGWDLYEQVRDQVIADHSIPPFDAPGKSELLQIVRLLGLCEGQFD